MMLIQNNILNNTCKTSKHILKSENFMKYWVLILVH